MTIRAKIFFYILLSLAILTHALYFGYPKQVVFDEIYFGTFTSNYLTGHYFLDMHPPLGKLMLALTATLSPVRPAEKMFDHIGEPYPNNAYIFLRLLPSMAGILLPLIIFLLCQELEFSDIASFFAGLFIILESSLLVESRFIFLDIFILVFGFTGLLLYIKYRKNRNLKFLIAASVFLGAALSIKWTGFAYLGLVGLFECISFIRNRMNFRTWLRSVLILIIIPVILYTLLFAIHFYLLPYSGTGDAFMSPAFRETLIGSGLIHTSQHIQSLGFFGKFIELNKDMYLLQSDPALAHHPYESKWYTWLLMLRPIYYWNDTNTQARIYLFGNPVIYWSTALGIVCAIILLCVLLRKKGLISNTKKFALIFLMTGFLASLLPFIFIHRTTFLYHYMTGLVFAILILTLLIDLLSPRQKLFIGSALVFLALVTFIYFAPVFYGLPLSDSAFHARVWFPSWQ